MSSNRYKLTIEYDGTNYAGFQIQQDIPTIASVITEAIFNVSRETTNVTCTGRTDSGVHAEGQVIHFDLNKEFSEFQLLEALNSHLRNKDIAVVKCEIVDNSFDARRNSKSKIYRYQILNRRSPSPILKNYSWHIKQPLNINAMQKASN